MSLLEKKEDRNYVYILGSDGTLRKSVPEGTEGAIKREYEDSKGNKGVKHELVFSKLQGKINDVYFYEGDFGKNLLVEVQNGDERVTLSLNVGSNFGEDLMKKIPNVDFTKEISFEPFSFENDKGKTIKGISIKQDNNKIQNFYFDPEAKKSKNGIPEPEGDVEKYDNDAWKIHFLKVRKFLVEETEKLIASKFAAEQPKPLDYPDDNEEGLDPSKMGF